MPFQVKNPIFSWRGPVPLPRLLPSGEGYSLPTPHLSPPPNLMDPPLHPPEFQPDLCHWPSRLIIVILIIWLLFNEPDTASATIS